MTAKSRAQVDKEIHIRRSGGKVPAGGLGAAKKIPNKLATKARSVAQVDKDAHRRALGVKTPARGKHSDAALGRGAFTPSLHPRKKNGEFR